MPETFDLEAGKVHTLAPVWTLDGTPDPNAKLLGAQWQQPQESNAMALDLTEATPGSQVPVVVSCSVEFGDGTTANVGLSGTVNVVLPVAPDPADALSDTPSEVVIEPQPEMPAPAHVYGGELGFSD